MASKNRRTREEDESDDDEDANEGDIRSAKRQKTFHHHTVESPVRVLANVGRLPEHHHHSSTSGDESGKSTPVGGHSRRESAASFVSDASSSCTGASSVVGVGGDSEREDDAVVGTACHDDKEHPHQFPHRPSYLAPTPPPLVGTPELSAMARMQVSPAIPSAAR